VLEGSLERHGTAERMTDQMGLGDIERVEEIDDRLGQRFEIARPDILAAFAMAWKVERIGLVLGGEGWLGEHPVVQIAAKTVDEDHCPPVMVAGLGQFPRRRGGGWVRQIALTSFLPGAVVIDFPDDLCAAARPGCPVAG
jgi:hypothetical protein